MRIKNQIGASNLVPPNGHHQKNISHLMGQGWITDLYEGGFPIFTPLGTLIIENIERILHQRAVANGFDLMRIPNAMRNDVLEKGQDIGDQFRQKIMSLTRNLSDYHIIATPEALFIDWSLSHQLSHHQLPIRMYYMDELHRQMPCTKGNLIARQIRIFGGVSLERKNTDPDKDPEGVETMHRAIRDGLDEIGLPVHQEHKFNGLNYEYFYIASNGIGVPEGENIALPSINQDKRTKGFSVGMIYEYPMKNDFAVRFRNERNRNEKANLITFGVCTPRVLYCMMMESHDSKGFNFPESIRPFDFYIIPESQSDEKQGEELYQGLSRLFNKTDRAGRVALDSRFNKSERERSLTADYIGSPYKIIIGASGIRLYDRDNNKLLDFVPGNASETIQRLRTSVPKLIP